MKKSTLIMALALILSLALGIGGTLAYLTDTDADVNVFVMGDVQIQQNEQQRVDQSDPDQGLESFEDYKTLLPYVTIGDTTKDPVEVGDYTIEMRDESVKNYVDKIVTVSNTGSNDAFVRTIIAIPTGGWEYDDSAVDVWLHWNGVSDGDTNPKNGWYWGLPGTDLLNPNVNEWPGNGGPWDVVPGVMIGGVEYDLMIATNKNILKPGETTAPSLVGLYLDSRVDRGSDGKYYMTVGGEKKVINIDPTKVEVLVATQAVQADGFEEAGAWYALDAAFGDITTTNHPWKDGMPEVDSPSDTYPDNNPPIFPVNVTNADELKAALANAEKGDLIVLAEGEYGHVAIESTLEDVVIEVEEGAVVFFDITSEAKLDDVTIVGLNGTYPQVTSVDYVDGGVVNIDAGAKVSGLVIEGADLVLSGGRSSMVGNSEPSADVTIKESTIKGSKYLVYGASPMANLTIEGNTISNISSWLVLENAGDSVGAKLTITGNTFDACGGGMAKYLGSSQPDGAATVFTNNTLTNCKGHDGSDAKWFTIPGATSTITVSGNTLDGAAFEPGTAQGLGK